MDEFPEGFDLVALLAPIPGDSPAGVDLRTDSSPQSLYYLLRDARAEARAAERAMEAPDPDKPETSSTAAPPQWRTIRELGIEAIAERSKDLEIASWVTEALLRSGGLVGFTAGVKLMTGLVENYWDDLYPLPDEDGIETRVSPVLRLNGLSGAEGTLGPPLRRAPLFPRADGSEMQLWHYEQSEKLAEVSDPDARQRRIEAGVLTYEAMENDARSVPAAHFARLHAVARAAEAAWRALTEALDSRAGADSPPTSQVRGVLEKLVRVIGAFAKIDGNTPAEVATAALGEAAAGAGGGDGAALAVGVAGAITSREEALRNLAAIAEFFRRTEPLSPLSYTLQEAVRRARMSWPELLEEIVPDISQRIQILLSLGIRPPPTE
jgi:type VI secretion system protein ImpA